METIQMETRSNSRPPFLDTDALVKGSSDGTKQFRIEVDGFTTGTTRVLTPPDANLTLAAVTAVGDMLYASASGILTRLPLGTTLQKFRVNAGATAPEWYTAQPTRQVLTSGTSATYTTPAGATRINIRMVGGGGGGGAGTTNNGSSGGNTTFGASLTATGGSGGSAGPNGAGAAGGGGSGGDLNITGGRGSYGSISAVSSPLITGGPGGNGHFGGAGTGGYNSSGSNGETNSGAGGGAGSSSAGVSPGGGGGAGGYVELLIASPSATYSYTVGAAGAGGTAGTFAGGNGGSGLIIVDVWYD